MTIEEKAKRYDEASKEVKDFFKGKQKMYSDVTQTLEYLFPELKESDDERIKKNIKIALMIMEDNLSDFYSTHRTSQKDLIAWLEKQGEQKPSWSEEDEKNLFDVTMELEYRSGLFQLQPKDYSQMIEWLKSLRYRYAWKPSDEHIDILWDALCALKHDNYKHSDIVNSLYQSLKKLKEE